MFHIPKETITHGHPNYTYRQKGKQATLSCGYGGGVGALKNTGAKMPEEEMQPLVDAWRDANQNIVAFWYDVEATAVRTLTKNNEATTLSVGCIKMYMRPNRLMVMLPSGRSLCYQGARLVEGKWDKKAYSTMQLWQTAR